MIYQKRRKKRQRRGQRPLPGNKSGGREREMGGKGEHSECAAVVLLVAAAEEVSCQDSKGRQVSTDT